MENRKITRKHPLAEKIPFILAAVLMIVCQYLPNIGVAAVLEPLYEKLGEADYFLPLYFVIASLISLLFVFLFERWFYPEYDGSLGGKGFGRGMLAALPVIVFIIVYRLFKLAMGFEVVHTPTLFNIFQGLRAGINEEAAFRGIAVALLLRQFRSARNIWVPAVFTGLFFGLTHLLNLFSGDELVNVLVNVVFASAFGIIFGVVFTFSGNLWPVVLLHSLYDTLAFISEDMDMPNWPVYTEVALFCVIMLVYLLVMHKKRESLAAYWDTRWKTPHITAEEEPAT